MSRLPLHTASTAPAASQPLLAQIQATFGATPNMFRAVANAPAALASMWGSFAALAGGSLPATLGEQIAIAVANANQCHYCLAAHTALGRKAGLSTEALADAQAGRSAEPQAAAALAFAVKLVRQRAQIDGTDIEDLRSAGFDDGAIVEIIAHVALNLFTNYLNIALEVPVDFPTVRLRQAA